MAVKKSKVKKKAVKKKPAKKKTAKKKVVKKKAKAPRKKPQEKPIGIVTHYFPHVRAAVIKLKAPLSVGEAIKIKGHTTDFIQQIDSLQIDRVPIQSAKKGQEIGLLVDSRVRQHDLVFKA
ncbi:MAG: translation elongation factor-like protein [Candidatus Omnitrophota bacterium]